MLLEVEQTKRRKMPVALELRPDVDAEIEIDDRAEHRGREIKDKDGVGEGGRGDGAKAAENDARFVPAGAHVANV